ncbi:MFS transporter [Hamadaea tsunoensis]|uniref:MFS transporter n=1 Tax=Hamadaea tsunoensis TaxID=53368 RepID=UPI0012FB7476|nr:MFS transporter [Hamadaea tsunoensis]
MVARARTTVGALAVTSLVGYGCLFYAYAVLLGPIARDLGISTTQASFSITLCTLGSAVCAVLVGRWIDIRGGRPLMAVGSVAAASLLYVASRVQNVVELYAVWAGIGVTWALVLYEPAFAVIVPRLPPERRGLALLVVTAVGGFASTVFLPLTGALVSDLGWRTALVWLAVILGVTTVPLHLLAIPRGPAGTRTVHKESPEDENRKAAPGKGHISQTLRRPRFWLYAVAFTAHSSVITALGVQLVSILRELGHSTAVAATIAGLIGVLSVTGRLAITALARWTSPVRTVCALFGVQAVALGLLPYLGSTRTGAVCCVVTVGLGFGLATITRPALVAEHFGTARFGTVAGMLNTSIAIGTTTVPLGVAALHGLTGGYRVPVEVCAALFAVAGALLAVSTRSARDRALDERGEDLAEVEAGGLDGHRQQ